MSYETVIIRIVIPITTTILAWAFATLLKIKNDITKLQAAKEATEKELKAKRFCNNDTHKEVKNQMTKLLNNQQLVEREVNKNTQKSVKFETVIESLNQTIRKIEKNNEKMNEKLDILIMRSNLGVKE